MALIPHNLNLFCRSSAWAFLSRESTAGAAFFVPMKRCSKCKRDLDEVLFVKSSRYLDGLYPSCKECRGKLRTESLSKDPMCRHCRVNERLPGGAYCSDCKRMHRTSPKRPKPVDWAAVRKICIKCKVNPRSDGTGRLCDECYRMCPKCGLRERAAGGAVWCYVCLEGYRATYKRPQRRPDKAYRSLTEEEKVKRHARKAVNLAIKLGVLKREPCEVCGCLEVEGHHQSYERDQWLKVRWICKEHHAALETWERSHLTTA